MDLIERATPQETARLHVLCTALGGRVDLSPRAKRALRRARLVAQTPRASKARIKRSRQALLVAVEPVKSGMPARSPLAVAIILAILSTVGKIVGLLSWLGIGPSELLADLADPTARPPLVAAALMALAGILIWIRRL